MSTALIALNILFGTVSYSQFRIARAPLGYVLYAVFISIMCYRFPSASVFLAVVYSIIGALIGELLCRVCAPIVLLLGIFSFLFYLAFIGLLFVIH